MQNMTSTFRPATLLLAATLLLGTESALAELDMQCVMRLAEEAAAEMTLAEVREQCRAGQASAPESRRDTSSGAAAIEQRFAADRENLARPFTIMAHKPTYFMPVAYNDKEWNDEEFKIITGEPDFEHEDVEAQFQISLKVPLAVNLFNDKMDLYFAYTNRSFWQVYNDEDYGDVDSSRPFRETNHEPEIWAQFRNDWSVLGFTNVAWQLGIVHQSNGRATVLSRSWNRVYANFLFEKGPWAVGIKPWVRIREDRDDDDNPDITDYLGHGEIKVAYKRNGHTFSMMTRNYLENGFDEGAVQLGWSFPVFDYPYFRGYVQYFYGHGESMIDYDNKVHRIGVGISLTDYLD